MSLISHAQYPDELSIYVFTDGVSEGSKAKLRELQCCNANIILKDANHGKFGEVTQSSIGKNIHVSSSALLKFDIANLLSDIDTVLYLDGDVIINKSIEQIFQVKLRDAYVAAADDMLDLAEGDGGSCLASRIGIKGFRYFNSGVMLLNLRGMREDDMVSELINYRLSGLNYFMDQDAFNNVLGKSRVSLPCS